MKLSSEKNVPNSEKFIISQSQINDFIRSSLDKEEIHFLEKFGGENWILVLYRYLIERMLFVRIKKKEYQIIKKKFNREFNFTDQIFLRKYKKLKYF